VLVLSSSSPGTIRVKRRVRREPLHRVGILHEAVVRP